MSQKPSNWQRTALSGLQIQQLCMMAGQAFKAAQLRGDPRTEPGLEEYRKAGQREAAQIESLKEAHQGHYLALKGYWFTQIGNLEQAFYAFLNAGEVNEARRQMAWRLMGQAAMLADGIKAEKGRIQIILDSTQAAAEAWRYAQAIAKDKFNGRRIDTLDTRELEHLGFSLTGNANRMLGKGKSENRNKKQRAGTRAKKTTPEAPLESPSRALEISLPIVHTARHAPADTMQL